MKSIIFITAALVSMIQVPASAQNQEKRHNSPYVYGACDEGCVLVNQRTVIYAGEIPKLYRVCTDQYGAKIRLNDNQDVEIPGSAFGVRSCKDFNARAIEVLSGTVAYGLLP
ncbi:hypothetical protein ACO0K0_02350 [Undibacterium sp. SXout11W]|uniref:hypothetical protein n=1 Tax=Undibacterium sp. SXout11W TaxID=3413050 RepID=UPI003BF16883